MKRHALGSRARRIRLLKCGAKLRFRGKKNKPNPRAEGVRGQKLIQRRGGAEGDASPAAPRVSRRRIWAVRGLTGAGECHGVPRNEYF